MRISDYFFSAAIASAFLTLFSNTAHAANFYVDIKNGSDLGDGTAENPWQSLQHVLDSGLIASEEWESLPPADGVSLVPKNVGAPVSAGDTIWLRDGNYGELNVTGYYNTGMITIQAAQDESVRFSRILVRAAANWTFRGLQVSPENGDVYEPATMIDIDSHDWQGPVHDITVDWCTLQSVADVSGWTLDDWNELPANGINADGTRITITNNRIKNVNFGIAVGASYSQIVGNTVENFAGDGMRGLGDYSIFAYNTVKNCYDVNDNHDDGFQSWSVGEGGVGTGEVTGIVLRGNTIINYEDPNQPFRGPLQGIGCFDGTFVDWVVENNVIFTDHWHGISFYGARNSRIVNNTVLDPNNDDPGPPWIMFHDHKDGTPVQDCVIANNLTTAVSGMDTPETMGNIIIKDASAYFVDMDNFDFHLLPQSSALDAGLAEWAPALDRDGIPRPQGNGVDVGAFEWHDDDIQPVTDTELAPFDTSTSATGDSSSVGGELASNQEGCACETPGRNGAPAPALMKFLFLLL
ncbi:MAG: right-handed parallel beta-helix repeat-containing protein [Deltaproteobacteria bacterium]|nr:right-handed parallel beta-helix repeat-containing protein [Deltaproteobacteria bacterium]